MPEEATIKNCWKGYDFDILNKLTEKGYLYPGKHKNKSVTMTKDGEKLAEELIHKYLKWILGVYYGVWKIFSKKR